MNTRKVIQLPELSLAYQLPTVAFWLENQITFYEYLIIVRSQEVYLAITKKKNKTH